MSKILRSRAAWIVGAALAFSVPAVAQPRPLTPAELPLLVGTNDPQMAPDGRSVAYVVIRTDYAMDSQMAEIWVADAATGATRRVAAGSSPRWSPDGRTLAYRGGSGERSGIWLLEPGRDSARFLTRIHGTDAFLGHRAVRGFAWSPDGTRIAFAAGDAPPAGPQGDIRVASRILYKTRTGFSDNRRTHLWVVDVAGGAARPLTRGAFDEHSLAWSRDGARIAFISNRSADPDANYSDDVWTVDVASGRETQVTRSVGAEFTPVWSPDGRSIAYLGNVRAANTKDSSPEDTYIYVVPSAGGAARVLARDLDRRIGELTWDGPRGGILFAAVDQGASSLYAVDPASGATRRVLAGRFQARGISADRAGARMAFIRGDATHPPEVWASGTDGAGARQLSRVNDPMLARVALQDADTLWTVSPDGTPIQGWLMKPAGFDPARRYPLILYIHGGPHGMYGYAYQEPFQLLAARGYAVLYLNPRGSTGYGQRFADGTLNNWGGGDYADLMAGVDAALARNPWLDGGRMGVIGGSYGGYMTNWIVARNQRFHGAVAVASVSNLISFYGTSVYPDLIETEFNGMPWDNYPLLWQWSPLAHVGGARTPTLFLHGESDNDVPITQAEEMYMALRKQGVPTELVRYAGEGHGIAGPRHKLDYYERIFAWFDRYVKGRQ